MDREGAVEMVVEGKRQIGKERGSNKRESQA
jgi:hypothetical protein